MIYHETEHGVLYCGDCLDILPTLADKSVDLVLTSPPYNVGAKSLGYHPKSKTGDNLYDTYTDDKTDTEYANLLYGSIDNCLRIARYTFYNIQALTNNKQIVYQLIGKYADKIKDIFIWKKQAVAQIAEGKLATGYEFFLILSDDNSMTFSYNNFPENRYVPNIAEYYKTKKDTFQEHHATFPLDLIRHLINMFSKPNDIVMDCFNGTGTTCLGAITMGRKYIGIEMSEKYCEIAARRIETELDQTTIDFS